MSQFPVVQVDGGTTRQVLADHPQLMMVSFKFPKDAEGALHSHPHIQSTFVKEGRFRFFIDGDTLEVSTGDSFVIPANAEHGCVCLESGELVDCFTPRRDDFL